MVVAGRAVLADAAPEVDVLPWDMPMPDLEVWLRDNPAAAVVFRGQDGLRLIARADVDQQLRGHFGFGAALNARRILGDLVSQPALLLSGATCMDEAARTALNRPVECRYDPVVVALDEGRLGLVSATCLIEHLAESYASMALTDSLTGLGNLRRLGIVGETMLRGPGPVVLFLFDLDRFKEINDALGHRTGDHLLQKVGAALQQASGGTAPVFRFEGDEFAVLIDDFRRPFPPELQLRPFAEQISWIGEQILREIRGPYDVGGMSITVEASIGAAYSPDHGSNLEALLGRAEAAMFAAKRDRTAVQLWRPGVASAHSDDLRMLTELREAIDAGQLRLHYQPLVGATSGIITSVEALLRWQHPARGLLMPGAFIAQAERSEIILALTDWVLQEAVMQAARWRSAGIDIPVAVNLAAPALAHDRIVETITELLRRYGVSPGQLIVEVTESAVMARPDEVRGRLQALCDSGVRIAMDDFGTGNTSLALLTQLPLHELKLDRSLISGTATRTGYGVVASVAQLARHLGLVLVGEGIEDGATARILADLGFDLLQGFHFGRPAAPDQQLEDKLRVNQRNTLVVGV